jgi:hypothetical protein
LSPEEVSGHLLRHRHLGHLNHNAAPLSEIQAAKTRYTDRQSGAMILRPSLAHATADRVSWATEKAASKSATIQSRMVERPGERPELARATKWGQRMVAYRCYFLE